MAKRLMARVGEYTSRDGETKGEWVEIGVILENNGKEYALIDPKVNLAGVLTTQNMYQAEKRRSGDEKARTGNMVMCSIFGDEQQSQQAGENQHGAGLDDDIPFSNYEYRTLV